MPSLSHVAGFIPLWDNVVPCVPHSATGYYKIRFGSDLNAYAMSDLSPGMHVAWSIAASEATAAGHEFIELAHLLVGLLSFDKIRDRDLEALELVEDDRVAFKMERTKLNEFLMSVGVEPTLLRRRVRSELGRGNVDRRSAGKHRSKECRSVFSEVESREISPDEGTACLVLWSAIILHPDASTVRALLGLNLAPAALLFEATPVSDSSGAETPPHIVAPTLMKYGRDLTKLALAGTLRPFVGRRDVILQVIQTLARESKNNPLLVGEPGVGKTAIVEAIARRAAEGRDPAVLGGKRIIEISMGTLVSGTKYRGEFEKRMTMLLKELKDNPHVLLFIDEIHTLIGAGQGAGNMDAADIFKPALARGEISCIGATTLDEYRKHIEKDPALERRFEKIIVPEPSRDETVNILQGIRDKWETHHNVTITDEAIEAAVDLSLEFDADHQLPDKAIDLIDRASSRTRVPMLSLRANQENVISEKATVTAEAVAHVLAEKCSIPPELVSSHLVGSAQTRVLGLEFFLKARVIGQNLAIETICNSLKVAHVGLGRRAGPLAVFLCIGPTGVGKTEVARKMAAHLFGDASRLIRFDMSEYMEKHAVSRLIGSPPGYIGHEDEGQLTGCLRAHPYSVILLDEIEKAHPEICDIFLQLFDAGRLTDAKGRTVSARNAIFMMTSNISSRSEPVRALGFLNAEPKDEVAEPRNARDGDALRQHFRPEFLNRITEVVCFGPLNEESTRLILRMNLQGILDVAKNDHGITLQIDSDVEDLLMREGFDSRYGARELHRAIDRLLRQPLADFILSGQNREAKSCRMTLREDRIHLMIDHGGR